MNILSISQLQTQTVPSDFTQTTSSKTENSSFADFLHNAQKAHESEKTVNEQKPSQEANEVAQKDAENYAENYAEKEEKAKPSENSEKLARKDTQKAQKAEEPKQNVAENEFDEGNFITISLNQIQNARLSRTEPEPSEANENALVLDDENSKIDDKMIGWLMSSSEIKDENEEISDEDFAKMIDAAIEFVPGFESEEEKLTSAQNLAISDPQKFLENAECNAENFARGAVKSALDLDSDKKTASKDSKEKKSDVRLSVHDLRTHRLFDEDSAKIASDKIVQKSAEKKEISLSMQKQADGNVQMTMELANRAQENITASSSQSAGANGSDFQAMLSNAVQENAPDFVKAGNIVLKDNNQGSINLILRPEGLGNVKISLNLDDKNLSAQITVQTKEAMDAFRESIPSLKQAFTESGFETGSFDLNFSNNQQNFAQGGNDGQNQQNAGLLAQKSYGDFVTASALSGEAADAFIDSDYSVNIVA